MRRYLYRPNRLLKVVNMLDSSSTLSVAFRKTINLGDTFWISEIRFQCPGPISIDNKAIGYIFSICHVYVFLSTCYEI